MIVREVKRALRRLHAATLSQLATELGASSSVVSAALAYWESRGRVRRLEAVYGQCSPIACSSCPIAPTCVADIDSPADEYIEWVGEAAPGDAVDTRAAVPVRR